MAEKRCYGCMKMKTESPVCEHCGFNEYATNAPHQLPFGTVLRGQYLVGKVLGQGGFGITYLGYDQYLDTPVAIKEYYPSGLVSREATHSVSMVNSEERTESQYRKSRDRFLREAKILARFANVPAIVQVRNFFEENNTAYIIMEYVQGIDLKRYINMRGGRLSVEETFAIMRPVMEALSSVHKEGLVHRDISPDNIMMLPRGGAKLLDFGSARDVENADASKDMPNSTEAILKHGFAPMEQYQRRGSLGPWTDVYALCATMYYCMTGRLPKSAPDRVMNGETVGWKEMIPALTDRQAEILEQGMALRAKDRIGSVEDLCTQLFGTASQSYGQTQPVSTWGPSAGTRQENVENYPRYTIPLEEDVAQPLPKTQEHSYPQHTLPLDQSGPSVTEPEHTAPVEEPVPVQEPQNVPQWEIPQQWQEQKPDKDKKNNKKLMSVLLAAALLVVIGCLYYFNYHIWETATCTEPAVCKICGKVGEEPVGHSWTEVTCTDDSVCTVCGITGQKATGHTWTAATCTEPQTCTTCGITNGAADGHRFTEATCTEGSVCTVCGEAGDGALGHNWKAATYNAPKTCTRCGLTDGKPTGYLGTVEGSWTDEKFWSGNSYTGVYELKMTLENCISLTIHEVIVSVDFGVATGSREVYGRDPSGTWTKIGTYYLSQGDSIQAELTFDTPVTIDAIAVITRSAASQYNYSFTHSIAVEDVQLKVS